MAFGNALNSPPNAANASRDDSSAFFNTVSDSVCFVAVILV